MSLSKRVSLAPQSPLPPQQDLKHRVITCLNKLSDRDTVAGATTELESIAQTLTHDSFAPFLAYLNTTSSNDKSPVRKQCVRILGVLSITHGNSLSPHVFKMLNGVVRRLRDSDSAVRSACVEAVASIASEIETPSFSALAKPLVEAVLTEQDLNAQIGSALCLSAAIEAAPDPEPAQLHKLLPRVLKLIKSDSFKAKPALLAVIGSIVGAGGVAVNRNSLSLLNSLISCLIEFLSSEDWATRKAAVEALGRLAVTENVNLTDFRPSCVASLENKRFDKVKVVRESMNRVLELWKENPVHLDEVPVSPQLNGNSASKDIGVGKSPAIGSNEAIPTRSPPKSNYKKQSAPIARKMDFDKQIESKVNTTPPKPASSEENFTIEKTGIPDPVETDKTIILETKKRAVSNKTREGNFGKLGGSRFGSRVVPFIDDCEFDMDVNGNAMENQKEVEDLSLIQKQLLQIENQQSNLLNLLQKFIGSSHSGMNSLEIRVNGLEKALDEISYDLAVSTGRVSNPPDSCCMGGTEFLSPKFWRKTEGQYRHFPFPTSTRSRSPFLTDGCLPNKDSNADLGSGGFALNAPGRSLELLTSARKKKAAQGQYRNFDRFEEGSLPNCIQQRI